MKPLILGLILTILFHQAGGTQSSSDKDLINAVKQSDVKTVRLLLARGANPNALWNNPATLEHPERLLEEARGSKRLTGIAPPSVLMISLGCLATDDPDWLKRDPNPYRSGGNPEITRDLIRAGANVQVRDADSGATALMLAAQYQDDATVALMIHHGAKVDDRDSIGATALIHAMMSDKDQTATIKLLLKHKADANARMRDGSVPLCYVMSPGELKYVRLLVRSGATLNARDKHGRTVLRQMIDSKTSILPTSGRVMRLVRKLGGHE